MSAVPVCRPSHRDSQSGSALIMSLMLLLVLMLTAVAGVSDSIVQERMANNAKRVNDSFQTAEAGLRYVEQQVRSNALALPASICTGGACEVSATALVADSSGPPGPDWHSVPVAVAESDMQVWYRMVRLGDSALAVNQVVGAPSTLYRISVLSQRGVTRTLLEGVYAFTQI